MSLVDVNESSEDETVPPKENVATSRRSAREATASNKTVSSRPGRASSALARVKTSIAKPVAGKVAGKKAVAKDSARKSRVNGSAARKSARSVVIVAMVGGLVATVALPAYAAWKPEAEAVTMQQVAAENAQSLVVASDASDTTLTRESYSATTSEEIEKKKAEEAAAERARILAEAAAAASTSTSSYSPVNIDLNMVAPGSGAVRWPVTNFHYTDINLFRPPSRPNHNGFDMLADARTPIYAVADGTVRVSQESLGGYGVAIVIDSVINGQVVSSLYGHMTYGSRVVSAGQSVSAGQLIGLVGTTGSSTANHLHLEVTVSGSLVDPLSWLQSNAG